MKSLHTLIRYKKQQLDELRRRLVVLESQKQQLLKRSADMSEELQQELELASGQPEMSAFFGDFAERIKRRQQEIAREVRKLDRQMDGLSEEIRLAFGEVKKYEIVRDRRKAEQQEEQNRKEGAALDEVALEQERRKKDA